MYTEVTWMRGNNFTEIVTEIPTSESAHQLSFIGFCRINAVHMYVYVHFFQIGFSLAHNKTIQCDML